MDEVQLAAVDAASPAARWAMTEYFAELDARFPEGFDATGALDDAATAYNPPLGTVRAGDAERLRRSVAAGCRSSTMTLPSSSGCGSPRNHRGQGLASTLLERLEDEVRKTGRTTVVLDTHSSLAEAITLYERRGYLPTERYNDNPYAKRWFRKTL